MPASTTHMRHRTHLLTEPCSPFPFHCLLPFVLLLFYAGCAPDTFDLEVRLRSAKDHPVVYTGSQVTVRFGNSQDQPPQPLTEDGRAIFPKLDRKLLHDTIRLTYLPENGRPYRVIQQVFYTAADRQQIDFTIELIPETTHVQFSLKDKNGLLPHALIRIDNKIMVESDDYGFVDLYIPKTAGSMAHFIIEKDGKTLLDKDVLVTDEYYKLFIEE